MLPNPTNAEPRGGVNLAAKCYLAVAAAVIASCQVLIGNRKPYWLNNALSRTFHRVFNRLKHPAFLASSVMKGSKKAVSEQENEILKSLNIIRNQQGKGS